MPDYAGACDAIEAKLRADWTAAGETAPIAVPNPKRNQEIQKVDDNGDSISWLYLEIADAGSVQQGIGRPGDQLWVYDGLISIHVFVPLQTGSGDARRLAVKAGDIFRARRFYADVPGYEIRTWAPRIDGGGDGSEDGQWFRVSAIIPFEYWHRG